MKVKCENCLSEKHYKDMISDKGHLICKTCYLIKLKGGKQNGIVK